MVCGEDHAAAHEDRASIMEYMATAPVVWSTTGAVFAIFEDRSLILSFFVLLLAVHLLYAAVPVWIVSEPAVHCLQQAV